MNLSDSEMRFLNQMKPRLLKEIECLKDLDRIIVPGKVKKYSVYTRMFIINAFCKMAGAMFFLTHDVHTRKQKELEDDFINFCKNFGELYNY